MVILVMENWLCQDSSSSENDKHNDSLVILMIIMIVMIVILNVCGRCSVR